MAENQAATREKVGKYIVELMAGLGVPGTPAVQWEKQVSDLATVEVSVNSQTARLRYTTTRSFDTPPAEFAVALCEDILRNRALFVTPALVSYATEQAHETFRNFDEKSRLQIVRTLFEQGFGLQRLSEFQPSPDATPKSPEAWAETCIGHLEAPQFVMYAHPNQIDPDDNPHDFNRLIEGADYFVDAAFKIKGIPFPKIKGEKRSDFASNEVSFRINDLLFPPRTMGEVTSENLQFVNFLTRYGSLVLNRGVVDFLLDSLESANPNLLALVRSRFSTDFITGVLRNLAVENISIRPLVRILEILVSGGQDLYRQHIGVSEAPPLSEIVHLVADDKNPAALNLTDWSELVRINLKNAIINKAILYFEDAQTLRCFYFENSLLEKIACFETLSTTEQASLRESVHKQIAENYLTPAGKIRPVITSAAWRKKIGDLISFEFPDTPVFSLQECLPRIIVQFDKMMSG
ncbi:MAG: hypothetical protein OHK0019_11490 [Saprospiraceae bacterium]